MWPEAQQSKSCPVTNLGKNEKKSFQKLNPPQLDGWVKQCSLTLSQMSFFVQDSRPSAEIIFTSWLEAFFEVETKLFICVKCLFDNLDHLHIILYKTYRSYHVTFVVFTHEPSPFPLARQPTWRPSPLALKCLVVQAVPGQGKPPLNHHFWGIIIYPPWN